MLGLADRARVIDLFEALMKGDVAAALAELRDQYDIGADPSVVLADLAEFTHFVTRVKVVPAVADDISLAEAERTRGRAFAAALSMRVLSRTWQMLLKGIAEVQAAGRPIAAAEMVLVRIAYVADLPTPDEAIRSLGRRQRRGAAIKQWRRRHDRLGAPQRARRSASSAARRPAVRAPWRRPDRPAIRWLSGRTAAPSRCWRSRRSAIWSRSPPEARPANEGCAGAGYSPGALRGRPAGDRARAGAAKTLVNDLSRKLQQWTGKRWMVIVSARAGRRRRSAREPKPSKAELETGVRGDPLVQAVLGRFPGAEIVGVRGRRRAAAAAASADDDAPPLDDDGLGDNWIKTTRVTAHGDGRFHGPDEAGRRSCRRRCRSCRPSSTRIEVEGTAGGGLVTVTLNAKGELKGVKHRRLADQAGREGNPRGPAGRRARRRAAQGRGADAGQDEGLTGGLPLPPGMKLF